MTRRIEWFKLALGALVSIVATSAAQGEENGASADETNANSKPAIEVDSELTDPFDPTARWLLDQPDARKRAAGLLYLSGPRRGGGEFDAGELLDELERAIATTTDGAALAWLASGCRSAGITGFCTDAGLDDAIVRHDSANLLSRLTLFPDAEAGTRDRLIIEAGSTRNYVSKLTTVWFEALGQGPGVTQFQTPHEQLVGAFSISMAHAIPSYQFLTTACGRESDAGRDLDPACTRLVDDLASDAQTLIGKSIGLAVKAKRAEARGDHETARQLEQRNVYESARSSCISRQLEDMLKSGEEAVAHEYMELLGEHGELEGQKRFAERHDIDCSEPDVPMAEALEDYATQLEGGA